MVTACYKYTHKGWGSQCLPRVKFLSIEQALGRIVPCSIASSWHLTNRFLTVIIPLSLRKRRENPLRATARFLTVWGFWLALHALFKGNQEKSSIKHQG